jgi:thiamine biosynthesis lipoprotein
MTVVHPSATEADALSTAFSLLPADEIASVLERLGEGEDRLLTSTGERRILRV